MGSIALDPALVLAAAVGALAVAAYGLAAVPPAGRLVFLLPAGLLGGLGGQILGARLGLPGPSLGGLHVLEALLGAWLIVLFVRRLVV